MGSSGLQRLHADIPSGYLFLFTRAIFSARSPKPGPVGNRLRRKIGRGEEQRLLEVVEDPIPFVGNLREAALVMEQDVPELLCGDGPVAPPRAACTTQLATLNQTLNLAILRDETRVGGFANRHFDTHYDMSHILTFLRIAAQCPNDSPNISSHASSLALSAWLKDPSAISNSTHVMNR